MSEKPKGMSEEQKNRLRGYMETMKDSKPDCVVCSCRKNWEQPNQANEFFATHEVIDGHIELCLYGVCTDHTSASLLEKAVGKLNALAKAKKPAKVNLLVITYNVDGEELKYA